MLLTLARWLIGVALLFGSAQVWSQEGSVPCQLAAIKDAFKQYVQSATQKDVADIQERLNALMYGPIKVDGVLGTETRAALQHFCRAKEVPATVDDLAATLVELLKQTPLPEEAQQVQQVEAEPEVREEPDSAPEPDPEPKPKSENLQAEPEVVQQIDNPKTEAEAAPESADSVTVYYRWAAPDDGGDEGEQQTTTKDSESDNALPDEIVKTLSDIEGVAYPNAMLFKYALTDLFSGTDTDYQSYLDQILEMARVELDDKLNPIQLQGDGCGCSRDFSSLVYGFYPAWLADGQAPQTVDFSLFDRISVYALALDEAGNIQNPLQWSDEWNVAGLINKAHRYWVDVDVTIQATGWQSWDKKVLKRAARSIAATVTQTFAPQEPGLLSDPLAALQESSTAQGDGVTLAFDNYTSSLDNRANIVALVTELAEQLADRGRNYRINILLDVDVNALDEQAAFRELEAILLDSNDKQAPVSNVFLFLQQPTTDAKKILRRNIEDEFRGAERKAVMRKIVPIISPHGHFNDPRGAFTQFSDDLIYFQDNFAGVGLWPLPLQSDDGVQTVSSKLIELYTSTDGDGYIGGLVGEYMPELCQFACPNRWLFRIAFDVLIGLFVVYGVAAIWICRLRAVYQQYFLYFLATGTVTLAILLISLVCDPYWQARADAVVVGLVLAIVAVVIWRYVSKATRPPLP